MGGRFGQGGRGFQQRPGPRALGPAARQKLMRANQLLIAGKALEAAVIFGNVGAIAQQNGMPWRSANLAARAALAYFHGGDFGDGFEFAHKSVNLSLQAGDVPHGLGLARQMMAQLKVQGHADQAETLRKQLDGLFAPYGVALTVPAPAKSSPVGHLPSQCPACLGPVHPDAIKWIDNRSAECAFCGTILQAE